MAKLSNIEQQNQSILHMLQLHFAEPEIPALPDGLVFPLNTVEQINDLEGRLADDDGTL